MKRISFFSDAVDFNLRFIAVVQISQPRDKCEYCHRHRHSEVGEHFTVVSKRKRDNSVQQAEYHHQKLSERVSFCVEYERSNADQKRSQGQIVLAVEHAEGYEKL